VLLSPGVTKQANDPEKNTQGDKGMLDFMLSEKHAISILKKDHETVKELFDKFENTHSAAEKEKIIARAVMELNIHASIEEEIFYPTVRKKVGTDIMNEADEEHHVGRAASRRSRSPSTRRERPKRKLPRRKNHKVEGRVPRLRWACLRQSARPLLGEDHPRPGRRCKAA
jgi:hypothetical protein